METSTTDMSLEGALTDFTFNLYSAIDKTENDFLCPLSVTAALLFVMLGTNGTTRNQMMTSIFKDQVPTNVDMDYKNLSDKLIGRTQDGVTLSVANRLFGSQNISILNTYTTNALKYYGSELEQLDFASQTEQSRERINSWIAEKTNNKIMNMLPPGSIDKSTLIVLVNAIYFKGTWKKQFDPQLTRKQNFYVSQNVQREVDMMFSTRRVASGENLMMNCKVLQLPYEGEKLSMIFVLPNAAGDLSELESKLTSITFHNILSSLRKQKTIINIPKFSIEAMYDLKSILSTLGITEIFDRSVADFSRMVPSQSRVYVSDARHKAYVEVNEEGSEAAAATSLAISITSVSIKQPFEFTADHPFLFLIRDNDSGVILFMGRFVNP